MIKRLLPVLAAISPEGKRFELWTWAGIAGLVGVSVVYGFLRQREKHTQRILQKYEEFRKLLEDHPHPMWVYARDGRCLLANGAACATYGYSVDELLEMNRHELEVLPDAASEAIDRMVPQPSGGRRTRYRQRSGELIWVNVYESDIVYCGEPAQFVIVRDVTDSMHYHQMLLYQAHHDSLTGLANRSTLEDHLGRCLEVAAQTGDHVLLLTIDIDHFKRINDTYGHLVGDECLRVTAQRLRGMLRQADVLARTGGEEFTALICHVDARSARRIAEKLLEAFQSPVQLREGQVALTISIGAAVFPFDGEEVGPLRQKSDEALYHAKRDGRNRACFAEGSAAWGAAEPGEELREG